ncbi:hypothetical protein KAR91_26505 [Candidatus Pacearchaeota archaeon]|nr:hypothetical protein [Candidatus Pacearchaeota archaeon]
MSTLGCVDFSSTDRERVTQILALLREKGTLDELGIGQIRDAFSDSLFPGFSTIQTRAKYFVIIPRICRDYQKLSKTEKNRKTLFDYLKDQENEIAKILVDRHGPVESQNSGIIGATRVNQGGVARRPSSIYWNGFRQFGIINTSLSLAEFCQKYGVHISTYKIAKGDDGADDLDALENKERVNIASNGNDWLSQLNINLTKEEAAFLKNKIRHSPYIQHSIPAQLFNSGLLADVLENKLNSFVALSHWLTSNEKISEKCRNQTAIAQKFSMAMEGAHIRYNCLIARKMEHEKLLEKYEIEFSDWQDRFSGTSLFHSDAADIWISAARNQNPNIKSKAIVFVREWNKALLSGLSLENLDSLVSGQAKRNKGKRSLLNKNFPKKDVWIGMRVLDYRWNQARRILDDIAVGLK